MSCSRFSKTAFTLVEVIAGLLLLSTLLVMVLIAFQRHAGQVRVAQHRLEALAAAEEVLRAWDSQDTWGTAETQGLVEGHPGFRWTWQVAEPPELAPVGAAIGRLEIVSASGDPLAAIDVLTSGSSSVEEQPDR